MVSYRTDGQAHLVDFRCMEVYGHSRDLLEEIGKATENQVLSLLRLTAFVGTLTQ